MDWYRKDELLFYKCEGYDAIVIEDRMINQYTRYINENNIKNLIVNDSCYSLENLDFLYKCTCLENIEITTDKIEKFSGIYELKNLAKLYIDEANGWLDLTKLKQLEELITNSMSNMIGLNKCINLKTLSISKYKPKTKNLQELCKLTNLENLQIVRSQITSLKGIENLRKLKEIEFYSLPKLEYINGLEGFSQNLKSLRFDCCKKIKNHEYVTCLKELELLAFDNCKEIQSIEFIREMPKLKKFMFVDTNVADGDLSPCIGLEYVGFFDKKHYSHKFKELNDKKYWG